MNNTAGKSGLAIVKRANVLLQVEKLVAAKVERGKNYQTLVNFSAKEKFTNVHQCSPMFTNAIVNDLAMILPQVEKLVAAKVERGKNYRTLVNFSTKELEEVNSQPLPLNSTLWRWHG